MLVGYLKVFSYFSRHYRNRFILMGCSGFQSVVVLVEFFFNRLVVVRDFIVCFGFGCIGER